MKKETRQTIEQFKELWKDDKVKQAIVLYHTILDFPDEEYETVINEIKAIENRQQLHVCKQEN